MSNLLAAIDLAASGIPCFPCKENKTPATIRGFYAATTDAAEIKRLWKQFPGPLIGVPTGAVSGIDVLDIDSSKHNEAVCWWMSNRLLIPPTRAHRTRSGGLHLLFRHDPRAKQSAGKIAPGIDVRTTGGYIIWWPAAGFDVIRDGPTSAWTEWLIARQQPKPAPVFRSSRQSPGSLEPLASFVASLPEGQRNSGTFWASCRAAELVAEGTVVASDAIGTIAEAAMRAGLPKDEAVRTVKNAIVKGPRHGR
jgi:hypothetical protein